MTDAATPKLVFDVVSVRLSAQASQAHCKQATIALDTNMAGNPQPEPRRSTSTPTVPVPMPMQAAPCRPIRSFK